LTTIAERISRPGRMKSAHRPATNAIRGTEVKRSLPTPIEDQQLVLDEDGFRHYGTDAAGTREPGDCR